MPVDKPRQLMRSWQANAEAWARVVREQCLPSRRLVTDAAVLDAIAECAPRRVLDVGCGEGWLCRALAASGIEVLGVDASRPLILQARAADPYAQRYHELGYDQLAEAGQALGKFDLLVCNFALLEEDLLPSLKAMRSRATDAGLLLIQTLHPWQACASQPYVDGWRVESFSDFGNEFTQPMPWFFRTLQSWLALLAEAGWQLQWLQEPKQPQQMQPASMLLLLRAQAEPGSEQPGAG
ncbi:class I SAM-dependent methyltransferase [Pseudomonas sp. S9]|uniref:class I SAM-dependent methyltransferase n=1 Tax=Pseudomonas sp. S9 TaxID=686578 RepID=UPI00025572B3|nr:class I SAM-dependent methyltransferase [Pseudomonas sp. S9]